MTPTEPLPLHHSWALADVAQRLDLGRLCDDDAGDAVAMPRLDPTRGHWACDLADNSLHWSSEVYRLFGLPDAIAPTRAGTLPLYAERSRAAMERLRSHAIRHRRGFTLDIEVYPANAATRWIRLVAAPVCEDQRVVRLHGSKSDVTHLYAR
ncbi:hypothetical protein LPN01_05555 [Sphingomonas sp. A2-49]|uniref:hypothetical protein n=1 Tax=Sphingomonas sp. A2-49 TaxID=1391375 RepID=UPI0021D00C87|nr:hypothetical protein [Sphingomonas sp. A2-49]MCU6453537.1 hypothetical protein [Sphingomonas sp. A2-49]